MVVRRFLQVFLTVVASAVVSLAVALPAFADDPAWVDVYPVPYEGGEVRVNDANFTKYASEQVSKYSYVHLEAMPAGDYTFMGWFNQTEGYYLSGDSDYWYYITGDIEITAEFQKVPEPLYYVSLSLNDPSMGWVSWSASAGYYGDPITIEAYPAPGYVFKGWSDLDSGFPVSASASYTFSIYDDVNYMANFEEVDAPHTIYIMPGGGTGYMPDPTVTDGDTYYLPECEFTPPYGKEFDTWDVGDPGTGIVIHSDMTITAQWKDKSTYTVHIEPNGGTGYMPDPELDYGDEYTLPECDFTPPYGKQFDKWDEGKPGEKITIYGETWIYAQWKDADAWYLVYIDPNGGSGYMPDPYVKDGDTYTLPECEFTAPEGMEFDRWNLGKPGDKIKIESDTTLSAQWKKEGEVTSDPSASSASASASSASADASASSASASSSESASSAAGSASATASSGAASASSGASGAAASSDFPILPVILAALGGGAVAAFIVLFLKRKKDDE